ncbi:polysaccharide deacetylase family protein [Paenibacillus sp. IHBB 10380]|uniref:polysaccharide deacetylase family protein n=1 Tax=Paenibacillus sp. IHBB 10380 TaxID=1566358 RepID=UPI0009E4E8C2|nr:polysaccharide deacetylase family protein [Paenibacillus sp. IHBB 10380]
MMLDKEMLYKVETMEKKIYLTFDDGPDPLYTPQILDILRENGVKATFFLIGEKVLKYPELVKLIYSEGHAIGNHTYTHPFLVLCDESKIKEEIEMTEAAIRSVIGDGTSLFRPPYGLVNEKVVHYISELEYQIIMWSKELEIFDWSLPGVDNMINLVLEKWERGSILLFHDGGGDRTETVECIEKLIPLLHSKGCTFSSDFAPWTEQGAVEDLTEIS